MGNNIRNIKEHQTYIFFIKIANSYQLLKHNIFTKKNYVVFDAQFICDYYCFDSDLVIHFIENDYDHMLFWDNRISGAKKLACSSWSIHPLVIDNKLYLMQRLNSKLINIFDYNGIVRSCTTRGMMSSDGKCMMDVWQYPYIHVVKIKSFDSIKPSEQFEYFLGEIYEKKWIYSNFLIHFKQDHRYMIQNLNTGTCLIFDSSYNLVDHKIFVLGNYLLDIYMNKQCIVYHLETLGAIATVHIETEIIATNNLLNVLISKDFQYYRINDKYGFQKVIMGRNYYDDYKYVPNQIKIIMDLTLTWIDFPLDLLFNELYEALIMICLQY